MEDRDLTELMTKSATKNGLEDSIDATEAEMVDVS
jgi:hypothetical protein